MLTSPSKRAEYHAEAYMSLKTRIRTLAAVLIISVWALQHVSAVVIGVDLGTVFPPGTLGGYTMTPYDPGSVGGGIPTTIGVGWSSWGQNYVGTVYATLQNNPMILTLSPGTTAVYFYEEPNGRFANFTMTATDVSGVTVTQVVNGNGGSAGVGFYETVVGDSLSQITITSSDPNGFAIGEFGYGTASSHVNPLDVPAVPETGRTLVFLAIALPGLFAYSRFTRVGTV